MNQIEFFSKNVFFTTRQYAFSLEIAIETASRRLHQLEKDKSLVSLTRGVWAQLHHPFYSPYGAIPYLLGNEQGYLSFLTALHRHDVISQIPKTIQIATTGRGRLLVSERNEYEFFQLQPQMMRDGICVNEGRLSYNIASPEKALLDTLYLSTRKGRRFAKLPEVNQDVLDQKELNRLLMGFSKPIQALILPRLEKMMK